MIKLKFFFGVGEDISERLTGHGLFGGALVFITALTFIPGSLALMFIWAFMALSWIAFTLGEIDY